MSAENAENVVIQLGEVIEVDEIRASFSRFTKIKGKRVPILTPWIFDLFYDFIKALYENTDLSVEQIAAIFRSMVKIEGLPESIDSEFSMVFLRQVEWVFSLNDEDVPKKLELYKPVIFEENFVSAVMAFSTEPEISDLDRKKKNLLALLYSIILLNLLPLCGPNKDS